MKDIAIYGAGGLGREIACLLRSINDSMVEPQWNLIGFFDDGKDIGFSNGYGVVLGGINVLNDWENLLHVVIAIGSPNLIKSIVQKITNPNIVFPNIYAPDVFFADKNSLIIGKGNIFQHNCVISCHVSIGDFNILNGSDVLGHDVEIDNYNVLMPAVRISGEVKIGEENLFGMNSCVIQQIKIDRKIVLGAGSVLMTKPKNGNLYIGVPAKIFKF